MSTSNLKTLRWGILGCGTISSSFVADMVADRHGKPSPHILQAIGSSSVEKAAEFVKKHAPGVPAPALYPSYEGVYNDGNVDIIYIGTPHSLHLKNSLDAIKAGKHVLCEKPLSINSKESETIIAAAQARGVFFMEAVWTRFFPIAAALQKLLHEDAVVGPISRVFIDFSLDRPLSTLPPTDRNVDPSLGAGALLDIGIYPLTWASIILDQHPSNRGEAAELASSMTFTNAVDEMTSVILNYRSLRAQCICTCAMHHETGREFCRIEGAKGSIVLGGPTTPRANFLIIRRKGQQEERIDFQVAGKGFQYEQDSILEDLRAGRKESAIMPLKESLRMMRLMDKIRAANGLRYPQDDAA